MAQQPRGTLLQMARMIKEPVRPSFMSLHKAAWDSESSSDVEELKEEETSSISSNLHTLTSAVSLLQQSMKDRHSGRDRELPSVPIQNRSLYASPIEYREPPRTHVMPSIPVGMDSNLFRTVYEMGFNAGLARRDPEPPCAVCVGRREKNRIAAQEARKRARLQNEEE